MFKMVLEKAEEAEIKFPTSAGSSKKQESSRKTSISALLTRKLSTKELMLLNCGVGEDSWESLGLQGDPTSPS